MKTKSKPMLAYTRSNEMPLKVKHLEKSIKDKMNKKDIS